MHGDLDAATVVALDRLDRTHPLQPRHGRRLRIVDAATGQITQQAVVTDEVAAQKGLSDGRALVTTAEHTLLLGPVPAARGIGPRRVPAGPGVTRRPPTQLCIPDTAARINQARIGASIP